MKSTEWNEQETHNLEQQLKEKMKPTGDKFQDLVNCLAYIKNQFPYDEINVIITSNPESETIAWSIESTKEKYRDEK